MADQMSCGEATIRLLERYGVDTVFGIPGVHTLEFCRGLAGSTIRHVQARNEQGAGFMADGYARASNRPGVALVISGPGVTNAATAIGQSFADSVPVLLLSSETDSRGHGKGWGMLHEITEQKAVTAPLTAMSATANRAEDVPELLAQAFSIFASERPRPVHVSIPIDVLDERAEGDWQAVALPGRPAAGAAGIAAAAAVLREAERPLLMLGGGASHCPEQARALTERLNCIVLTSTAGKGIVPDQHPLNLGASTVRPESLAVLESADVVLAVGTELAETDSFIPRLPINGKLVRIDVDARKINDLYPATVGIVADAATALDALLDALGDEPAGVDRDSAQARVAQVHAAIGQNLTASERQHVRLLSVLRDVLPPDTLVAGDIAQLVYTGAFAFPVTEPGLWHYPAGFCTLGCGLPNGIGAILARPQSPVVVLAGDGGIMFTVQELMCAVELELPLPVVIWENGGLKQIQDDMRARNIPLVGVEGINPDFVRLAEACGSAATHPASEADFRAALAEALQRKGPTVIVVREDEDWLT